MKTMMNRRFRLFIGTHSVFSTVLSPIRTEVTA